MKKVGFDSFPGQISINKHYLPNNLLWGTFAKNKRLIESDFGKKAKQGVALSLKVYK